MKNIQNMYAHSLCPDIEIDNMKAKDMIPLACNYSNMTLVK